MGCLTEVLGRGVVGRGIIVTLYSKERRRVRYKAETILEK